MTIQHAPTHPYTLGDDHYHRLTQIHGTLAVLTDLTGMAKPEASIDCASLHHTLWGLQDNLEAIMQWLAKQNRDMLSRARESRL